MSDAPAVSLNATLVAREEVNPQLAIFRVRPDAGVFTFRPGQFAVLGLPASAPAAPPPPDADGPAAPPAAAATSPAPSPAAAPPAPESGPTLIRRAYSIASSPDQADFLEFYIQLIPEGTLTPRLWALRAGDRLWLGPKPAGRFTLDGVEPRHHILMVATGTGLAPYVSMLRGLLDDREGARAGRRVAVVHGARYACDLGYRSALQRLDLEYASFLYAPTISRPRPGDHWVGHTGRAESVFRDGTLERALGLEVRPPAFHVFLCGNPGMVEGMTADFTARGFVEHTPRQPGDLHLEKYWS